MKSTDHMFFLLSVMALASISLCSFSSCLFAYSCPNCIKMTPTVISPTSAFPAAKTRTASILSTSVGGTSLGGGEGRMEKLVMVEDSGTGRVVRIVFFSL